jgi:dTDP-4-dehydrorhamnose reductase
MRVLITGAAGLFGHGLRLGFAERHQVTRLTRPDADITNSRAVRSFVVAARPDVVIHAAANPDIDACEEHPAEAHRVNVDGTRNIVEAARMVDAGVALISTDAVFDGHSEVPYKETDPVNPPSVYGRTKVEAERLVTARPAHWVVRVSLLFGPRPPGNEKQDFVEKGLRKLARGEEYVVAADQLGSALYTLDGARVIEQLLLAKAYGVYHVSNQGACTRYDLARRAAEFAGLDARRVVGRPISEMRRPGPRLRYGVLALDRLTRAGIALPRRWEPALEEYVRSLGFRSSIDGQE